MLVIQVEGCNMLVSFKTFVTRSLKIETLSNLDTYSNLNNLVRRNHEHEEWLESRERDACRSADYDILINDLLESKHTVTIGHRQLIWEGWTSLKKISKGFGHGVPWSRLKQQLVTIMWTTTHVPRVYRILHPIILWCYSANNSM